MKAVFVFAVLALCAFAVNIPKIKFPKIQFPKVTRDEGEMFTPAPLNCEFSIKYKMEYTNDDSDSEWGSLFPSSMDMKGKVYGAGKYRGMTTETKMEMFGVEVKMEEVQFIRPDIEKDGEFIYVATVKAEAEGEKSYECEYEYVDKGSDPTEEFIYTLNSSVAYTEKKEDQEWDGEKCTMYYYSSGGYSLYNFCVDSDDHIIGYNMTSVMMTFSSYKDSGVSAGDFSAGSKYKGCEKVEEIYDDPEDDPDCEFSAAATVKVFAAVVLALVALLF